MHPAMHPHPPSHSHLPTSHLFNQPKPTLHINLLLPYCERSLLQHYCHNVAAVWRGFMGDGGKGRGMYLKM
ncbi:hypothetical protein HBI65_074380 [Parastagonospora nodorum]|nr:hypothetical protein HBH51_163960 [Parastagonospora nodorum]KAH5197775.1 hypothetical protein HBH76_033830 [Parastagonospora nodorum]KAH5244440.1 hypothetical protein HBI72_185380 [Parastagonospora nodorum]KAH6098479.1 hypothetical protein HBI65_074380 [Parastagonospora nodorum]KAH6106698.1 hypothetical protein HBI69_179230 [Parastagonospora nodorum]